MWHLRGKSQREAPREGRARYGLTSLYEKRERKGILGANGLAVKKSTTFRGVPSTTRRGAGASQDKSTYGKERSRQLNQGPAASGGTRETPAQRDRMEVGLRGREKIFPKRESTPRVRGIALDSSAGFQAMTHRHELRGLPARRLVFSSELEKRTLGIAAGPGRQDQSTGHDPGRKQDKVRETGGGDRNDRGGFPHGGKWEISRHLRNSPEKTQKKGRRTRSRVSGGDR